MRGILVAAAVWWACLGLVSAGWEAPPSAFLADGEILAFFGRQEHGLARAFAEPLARRDTARLRAAFDSLASEEPEAARARLRRSGLRLKPGEVEAAAHQARGRLKAYALLAPKRGPRPSRRLDLDIKPSPASLAQLGQASREKRSGALFDADEPRARGDGFALLAEGRGIDAMVMAGAGAREDGKFVGSTGAMGRFAVLPLSRERAAGDLGVELGAVATIRRSGRKNPISSTVESQAPGGGPRVLRETSERSRDDLTLMEFFGLSYRSPVIARGARKLISFDVGARLGLGRIDNRTVRVEERVLQDGAATYALSSRETVLSGSATTAPFYAAFAAANLSVTESLKIRLEGSGHFLGWLDSQDAILGRLGVTYRFKLR